MHYSAQELEDIRQISALYRSKDSTPFSKRKLVNTFNRLSFATRVKLLQERAPSFYEMCSEDFPDDTKVWANYKGLTNFFTLSAECGLEINVQTFKTDDPEDLSPDTLHQIEPLFGPKPSLETDQRRAPG